ncbi:MAG: rhodanese-like domain-containing protein [Nitrosomonas sp.]|nr:rhodanese-like domain-containing protein [Nitrosomonas sp.]MBK7365728.1 rhodanese-like domain-containing protein [Nitrosomonas sp.]
MYHAKRWLCYFAVFYFLIDSCIADSIAPKHVQGAQTIDTLTAKLLFDQKTPFIDVRKHEDFIAGHIPGAYHLSIKSNFDEPSLQAIVDKESPVVVYCNGIHCMGSSIAAQKAVEWGWTTIYYYREGIPAWKNNAHPIQTQ